LSHHGNGATQIHRTGSEAHRALAALIGIWFGPPIGALAQAPSR
jgi:hypothetical protein